MIFLPEQLQELLNVISYHHLFVASTTLGVDVLSEEDKELLRLHGVDIDDLNHDIPVADRMYHFGKLAGILRMDQALLLGYNDFLKFIKLGQYIPLNAREKFELDIAKRKTYTYLKGLNERARGDLESSILSESSVRKLYEDTVQEGLVAGVADRKSVGKIISDLGHKIEEWRHDWGRIVETEMNNIFQIGKAATFFEKDGIETLVWKQVYEGACRHCIEKYLTAGLGSKPRVFKLSDLAKNLTNVGRKVAEWVATLGSLHPYCRCDLRRLPPKYVWNEEIKRFELPKIIKDRIERKSKVKITVGDKVFLV